MDGFFVPPDIDDDKDDEDDDIANNKAVPRFFSKLEVEALVEFINEHDSDETYSLDKW